MGPIGVVPGAARLHLVDGVSLLRPEDQVFEAMLAGFANQQLARNLARSTVEGRENAVRAFAKYVNAFPWPVITRTACLPQRERMALLGRLLAGHDLPLRPRVAGVIVLLYAQP